MTLIIGFEQIFFPQAIRFHGCKIDLIIFNKFIRKRSICESFGLTIQSIANYFVQSDGHIIITKLIFFLLILDRRIGGRGSGNWRSI